MNKLTLFATLGLAAVLILGGALNNQARADMIPVLNGDFETLYEPNTTNTVHLSENGWTQGVGPGTPIDIAGGGYLFDDGTSGMVADIPGWIGYDPEGWIDAGGTYGRDEATGNLQGSISNIYNNTGVNSYLVNGGGWHNPAGGLIVSDNLLDGVQDGLTYTLSMWANGEDMGNGGPAGPVTLMLLAGGVALTPSSAVNPTLSGVWQEFSRTYDAAVLDGLAGKDLSIVLGVGRYAGGGQSRFDDVSLNASLNPVPEPATMLLLGTGLIGLAGFRRKFRKA